MLYKSMLYKPLIYSLLHTTFPAPSRLSLLKQEKDMNHFLRTAFLLLSLLIASPAFAQVGSQPVSRPATVMLIARLESISVTRAATPAAPGLSAPGLSASGLAASGLAAAGLDPSAAPAASALAPVAITTSWAVPANSTTMRVVAYSIAPLATFSESTSEQASAQPLWTRQAPLQLFTQSVSSNARTSRTDPVPLTSDPYPPDSSGTLLIVAQAL